MVIAINIFIGLIAAGALTISILSYLSRNRPYVGVKEMDATKHLDNHQKELVIEIQNVGEIPATGVILRVKDSGGTIDAGDIFLGPLFPHTTVLIRRPVPEAFTYSPDKDQSYWEPASERLRARRGLGENAQTFTQAYPETDDATMVTCTVTYEAPGFWDRAFTSVQTFRVYHD